MERFTGFSGLYDGVRPSPPEKVCALLLALIKKQRVNTVVDVGCGTGLSTRIWVPYAEEVIGIEPNDDMRSRAQSKGMNARFLNSNSYETGLPDASADIVCCSQSFHWMEPVATLAEVSRILKTGGVFAVYDCDWPVSVGWESEKAYNDLFEKVSQLTERYKDRLPVERQWPKNKHLQNFLGSGYFSWCREIVFENTEPCDADRFIGIALSQGKIQTLLKHNVTDIAQHIEEFKETVSADIVGSVPMSVGYRMIVGIRK